MLVILFPVISATDDLHAMRAEMEESPGSKRSISQKSGERVSATKFHSQPLLPIAFASFELHYSGSHFLPAVPFSIPPAPPVEPTGRSPPASFPG